MELHTRGKSGNPAVLLLPGAGTEPETVFSALSGLEKSYCLLLPVFAPGEEGANRADALEKRLLRDCAGRIWGAYGLRGGADTLLSLFSRGTVRVRTLILEGAFTPPPAVPAAERIVCWMGSKDKAAKKAWKALEAQVSPLSTLTMKKLKKEQDLMSLRPDIMVKQLKKTLGKAVIVTRDRVISQSADTVWRQLSRSAETQDAAVLQSANAPHIDDERRTVILEGTSPRLKHWSHLTRVEALGLNRAVCTDQVELDAGALNFAAKPLAGLYLSRVQRRRARAARGDPHAV